MQKMLEEDRDRWRKAAEVKQPPVKEQPEAKIEDQKEALVEKKSKKLFPDSALFKEWGENLSEDDQREAQGLFEKYGYNVFLSDRLPLDRALPDTRDPRYDTFCHNVRPVILLHTRAKVKQTALIDYTQFTVYQLSITFPLTWLAFDKAFTQLSLLMV